VLIAGEKGGVDPDVSSATLYVTALNGPRSTGRDVARSGEAEPHFVPVTKPEIMNVVSGFLFGLWLYRFFFAKIYRSFLVLRHAC